VVVARRGAAEISYGGEEAVVEEGKVYRVELDPKEDDSAADEKNKQAARKKKKRKLILIAIGVGGGAGIAAGIWKILDSGSGKAFVSPDHP
jgi:chemotaxis response regulator CheB